jgi:rubrerythrin
MWYYGKHYVLECDQCEYAFGTDEVPMEDETNNFPCPSCKTGYGEYHEDHQIEFGV